MGHLSSILMWSKIFGKVKVIKSPAGFEPMAYRFVVNHLIHCTTLLDDNIGKETTNIIQFI